MSGKNQPYNVLLIGEDPKQTDLCTELVREVADCHVDVISRMESSFDWLTRFNYQLVIIDTSTSAAGGGGFDGIGLLEKIKRISPVTSVVLIAEPATVEQAVAAIRLGAEDYLKKPFSVEALQLAVKRGLDRKAVLSESAGASNYVHLLNACQLISGSLEQAKIFSIVQSYLSRELRSDHSAIYSLAGGEPIRVDPGASEERKDRAMEEVLDIAIHAANPLAGMGGDEFCRFIERGQLTPGLFVFRFSCAGDSDYFCVCLSPERPAAQKAFEGRLRMLKAQIEVTGRSIEQYLGVQHLVYVDDATGLYNTRYLHYILDRELANALATRRSFAVLFIDADRFKAVNDQHGHLVGTKLLNELGHHLKKYVRETDTVFRYGGDEFVAVLSPCDLATANAVAERIRASVEQREFLSHEGLAIHFTVSIGVALFPDHADSKQAVIDAADQAMYSAKKSTRNSVFVAAERGVVPLRAVRPAEPAGGKGEASGG